MQLPPLKKECMFFDNNFIRQVVTRRWKLITPLACSQGIIQTHAGKEPAVIVRVSNGNMRSTWQDHVFVIAGADLLICGCWLRFIFCLSTYIPATCFNQIAPYQKEQTVQSYLQMLQQARLSIHVSLDRHISHMIIAGPLTLPRLWGYPTFQAC